MSEAPGFNLQDHKRKEKKNIKKVGPGLYTPSTLEAEARGLVYGHSQPHSECEASLDTHTLTKPTTVGYICDPST